MKTLRLYVWEGVLASYTDGAAFALATSAAEARRLIHQTEPEMQEHELDARPQIISTPKGFAVWGGG